MSQSQVSVVRVVLVARKKLENFPQKMLIWFFQHYLGYNTVTIYTSIVLCGDQSSPAEQNAGSPVLHCRLRTLPPNPWWPCSHTPISSGLLVCDVCLCAITVLYTRPMYAPYLSGTYCIGIYSNHLVKAVATTTVSRTFLKRCYDRSEPPMPKFAISLSSFCPTYYPALCRSACSTRHNPTGNRTQAFHQPLD